MRTLRFDELLVKYMNEKGISVPELAKAIPRLDKPTESLTRKTLYDWRKTPRPRGEGTLPSEREYVLKIAEALALPPIERNQLLEAVKRGYIEREQFVKAKQFEPSPVDDTTPYVVGVPIYQPRQFFGREQALKIIFDLWSRSPLLHIAVIGPRCSGKTSLLYYLQSIHHTPIHELRPHQRQHWLAALPAYRFAQVNFANPLSHNQALLFKDILTQLQMPIPEPCDLANFVETITTHCNDIATFILLDDIEAGLHSTQLDQAFWGGFRYLGFDATRGKLAFLLTAPEVPTPPLGEPSTFIGMFGRVLALEPFTEEEANALIEHSARIIRQILNVAEPFTPADKSWMLEQSRGWPALLQILCYSRFEALQENKGAWQVSAKEHLLASRCWHYLLGYKEV